ncbi:hypothetical protein [Deinococcus soli (ex Cha et al. 2016)]|uniref:Tryptophan-rich sensory protein n=2 Tax=Deinococcus soli (ex Cha et al. 2016) TaxID=1309411 RepID=A0AAE3XF95_9DEIO|nr:hypothetical protein [Deinococcus soli (ex Cha et al. 2016)]MDR6219025.1 tryptophan-rich sensory protein [Deinococcus soli (ex Cha et al. 2016)]MDR6328822.1 tryptophan-rich sensory protein [Deinococcus soli (ex Cha et al. 2016)]MDR6751690.1 tryptophan-rich sensory protein [Deinococcus soli (ex Cha et al. 2016)]
MPIPDFSVHLEPLMHAADSAALAVMTAAAAVMAAATAAPQAAAAAGALLLFGLIWLTLMDTEDD